jgi:selenide,water dikinase
VRLADGSVLESDATLWATGAASFPWLRAATLAHDPRGFVRVRPTLQSVGDDGVFVAGDAASLDGADVPKSGVYAVRAAPVLAHNLAAVVTGGRLRAFRPQRDALVLLNAGDRIALGAKWGLAVEGAWVWRWKDRIDRRFVASLRG